jgi:anti-sigma factor RsiW
MRCEKVRGHLEAWLDGELPGNAGAEIERHLKGCAACARHLEQRRQLGKAVKRTLRAQTVGLHFRAPEPSRLASAVGAAGSPSRLASAVGAAGSPSRLAAAARSVESSFWPRFSARGLLALAAALLLALLFLFRPWAARQRTGDGPAETGVITVSDSLTLEDDTFVSGRMGSFSYVIHMQVSGVRINDHT